MEQLSFEFSGTTPIETPVHYGVVGSGDLEILFFPTSEKVTHVSVTTGSDGFGPVWERVLRRFFERYPILARVEIHDFGATPGVVYLRLTQALEVLDDARL